MNEPRNINLDRSATLDPSARKEKKQEEMSK